MNPPDQLIADARNHLDLLNDAARKREGARIIERLLARVRELESTLAERWPNLAHQDRDRLLALCGGRADVWLSTAACETIEGLRDRVRELETERAGLQIISDRGELWSFFRDVMSQGTAIQMDYAAGKYGGYEAFSARLDAAARERADQFAGRLSMPGKVVNDVRTD